MHDAERFSMWQTQGEVEGLNYEDGGPFESLKKVYAQLMRWVWLDGHRDDP